MNLTGQNIRHINSITHDGKVVVFGAGSDRHVYYSVKRSGFEDTAVQQGADLFGFEPWKKLRVTESTEDTSVIEREKQTLTDTTGNYLMRSVYDVSEAWIKNCDVPVQVVSALDQLYVFRQTMIGHVTVHRFVLDGMTNELVPKLEVRFARSKKRFEPHVSKSSKDGKSFDSLDYRDIDGNSFFEPPLELTFLGTLSPGCFLPVLVPTMEADRYRWHIFTVNDGKLHVFTVGADATGTFDVQDYLHVKQDPSDPEKLVPVTIPGIIHRQLNLKDLILAGAPSATAYDVQREQMTDTGLQLVREEKRLMVAVPVKETATSPVTTAVLDFALCVDGTLSQISSMPTTTVLRNDSSEVVTPLSLLDNVKAYAATTSPSSGVIAATERGNDDYLQVRSTKAVGTDIIADAKVILRGTQSYDGHYKVVKADGTGFEVEGAFPNGTPGTWEVVQEKQTGLVFDNMVVGIEKTANDRLRILCASHDLKDGQEVQISGTQGYDGTYSVLETKTNSFVLNAPYFTGEAANLNKVTRRGIRMDGNDSVETPDLKLVQASAKQNMARTLSAWVYVDAAGNSEQGLIKEVGDMMNLAIGSDNKVKLVVKMSDGSTLVATDPDTVPSKTWTHYSGSVDYTVSTGGSTQITLCRNGVTVASRIATPCLPWSMKDQVINFDGVNDYVNVPNFATPTSALTVSVWARGTPSSSTWDTAGYFIGKGAIFQLYPEQHTRNVCFALCLSNGGKSTISGGVSGTGKLDEFHLYTGTFNGNTISLYIDGSLVASQTFKGSVGSGTMATSIGYDSNKKFFKGQLGGVELWNRALSAAEIIEGMGNLRTGTEPGLVGCWPLDDGTAVAADRSPYKQHGTFVGNPEWTKEVATRAQRFPQGTQSPTTKTTHYVIGQEFKGEIADAQIWSIARTPAQVKRSMYLALKGGEKGLEANYRLGAIVYEQTPPTVLDMSYHARTATVKGDPYAGAKTLSRTTGSGEKVVKYGSSDVVEVCERCIYEETFEFKVNTTDTAFNPNNADGNGQKLFAFSYWGKSSAGSTEVIAFPLGSVKQLVFTDPIGGWYQAKCTVVVPDGVTLMRAFEISEITSKPSNEWTSIDIRKHHLRLVSDAITKEGYSDTVKLAVLSGQSATVDQNLRELRAAEEKVARYEVEIAELTLRLDIAKNAERYEAERTTLATITKPRLIEQLDAAQEERTWIVDYPFHYYQEIKVKHSGKFLTRYVSGEVSQWSSFPEADKDLQRWQMRRIGSDSKGSIYQIISKLDGKALEVPGGGEWVPVAVGAPVDEGNQKWQLESASDGYRRVVVRHSKQVLDVEGGWDSEGARVLAWNPSSNYENEQWKFVKTTIMTSEAIQALRDQDEQIADLEEQIHATQARIDTLDGYLETTDTEATIAALYKTASDNLIAARSNWTPKNKLVVDAVVPVAPASMATLATDARGLSTNGARLDFVAPIGRLNLTASGEGNVLASYFDAEGRIREAVYDAVSDDSRNKAFQQWLPEAVRLCADLRKNDSKITLEAVGVPLPTNHWSCEAWVQYPFATKEASSPSSGNPPVTINNGSAYGMNIVAAMVDTSDPNIDAPMAIHRAKRLGFFADGWYFDSGVDLDRVIGAGWHHFAVSRIGDTATFYADGVKLGSRKTSQPALAFHGSTDYIHVPAHASPTESLTVSIWARSTNATWNADGCLVSKRDAFVMHPNADTKSVKFCLFPATGSAVEVSCTPADIRQWHLYTATYDRKYLRMYLDGEFVQQVACTTAIKADSGEMLFGHDELSAVGQRMLKGQIAEVSYWNYARGGNDVREEFYRQLVGNEPGLFGYWRMEKVEDGEKFKVLDLSSSARHAEIKGAPTNATITAFRKQNVGCLGNLSGNGSPIGRLAEVRLWDLGLNDDEIAANARFLLSGNEPGLIGYWPLDDANSSSGVRDRAGAGGVKGTTTSITVAGFTAPVGNPGGKALHLPSSGSAYVNCGKLDGSATSFTFEYWARRSESGLGTWQGMIALGESSMTSPPRPCMPPGTKIQGINVAFDSSNRFEFSFETSFTLSTTVTCVDTDWHHWCVTYDHSSKDVLLYRDGEQVAKGSKASLQASGALFIGKGYQNGIAKYFQGDVAEVRIWKTARSQNQIQEAMRGRLYITENMLLAHYPLDEANFENKVKERVSDTFLGALQGTATIAMSTSLAPMRTDHVTMSEYGTTQVGGDGKTQSVLRRFHAYPSSGTVELLPEQRVEELTSQWVGNAQINPTLLGFIEGAPPVPSENFTESEDGYKGATTVTLAQSDEMSYAWQRSEGKSEGFKLESFAGVAWEVGAGVGIVTKLSEGEVGGVGNYTYQKKNGNESNVAATSILATSDSLTLTGAFEDKPMSRALGRRWIPKNVGYALVISGMADVFVTKLKRTNRMVSYDIKPVKGVPLDINTITFMMNPAYTLNGSLDGLVGSMPADATFYPHVPEMRAQYGSLYPASYYRLEQAYALKEAIDRQDKERESFFYNFDVWSLSTIDKYSTTTPSVTSGAVKPPDVEVMDEEAKKAEEEMQKRQEEIGAIADSHNSQVRASAAFADWQVRMEGIQAKAGKRNIVNTYVWDADGGLRVEEQSFASTIEHSMNTETTSDGEGGASTETMIGGFKGKLSLLGTGGELYAMSKSLNFGKALQLNVDLSGVEGDGVTDLRDNPLKPGEKVGRYRFMSFYLEGTTENFYDFFRDVVDPEWLQSNGEEARALRQAKAKPNKCWRVLHRVTYVERPALLGIGR